MYEKKPPKLEPYTTDGLAYIIRQPDEYLKIGYSLDVPKRMRTLARQIGGEPELLCVQYGGYHQERWLHSKFDRYRLPGTGEMFFPAQEILDYCDLVGIAVWSTKRLNGWTTKR